MEEEKKEQHAKKQKQNVSMTIGTRCLDHRAIFYGDHRKNQQWSLSPAPTIGIVHTFGAQKQEIENLVSTHPLNGPRTLFVSTFVMGPPGCVLRSEWRGNGVYIEDPDNKNTPCTS
ncbi:hypothetical protein TNIN_423481 [Trichonephila inaurata madagascariensis]|uniref:Uncharacterized protein n=1 Tax=Trichonephila inaurata madagascariensis TaxID=2747483 RepID=A0A8X6YC46_9ARAC|nr:hypothetical protein TNIN_423481 [Trichonephila inaurata madagascariensis]